AATGRAPQAALRLTKALPVASGIGGGSADAAATLAALSRLWGAALDDAALARLAQGLGADVPVCLSGRTSLLGRVRAGRRARPARAALRAGAGQPAGAAPDACRLQASQRPVLGARAVRHGAARRRGARVHARRPRQRSL